MSRTVRGAQEIQDAMSYAPRALRAERAAAYLGISKTKFFELVDNGRMPAPIAIDGVRVWDRLDLDAAFDAIKTAPDRVNTCDQVFVRK